MLSVDNCSSHSDLLKSYFEIKRKRDFEPKALEQIKVKPL